MKNIVTFLAIISTLPVMGQIEKEQWLIGGTGQFHYSKSKEFKISEFQISPNVGYFIFDKIAGGLRTGFEYTSSKSSELIRRTSFSIGPFVRYYFLPKENQVNLFADGFYNHAWSWYKNVTYSGTHNYHFYELGMNAGPAFFLNRHTSLELTVGYKYSSRGPIDSLVTNNFRVGIGFQIHLGGK